MKYNIMTTTNREQLVDEIFTYSEYSRCGNLSKDDETGLPTVSCACIDHPDSTSDVLREGSYVTCILQRHPNPDLYEVSHPIWSVHSVICAECPVASIYERADKTTSTAIVEGVLQPGEDCLVFSPRYIWDMHQPEQDETTYRSHP